MTPLHRQLRHLLISFFWHFFDLYDFEIGLFSGLSPYLFDSLLGLFSGLLSYLYVTFVGLVHGCHSYVNRTTKLIADAASAIFLPVCTTF